MSFKLPTFSKAKVPYQEFTRGLETFLWTDLSNTSGIGRGTFGSVLPASLKNEKTAAENVVVKKLLQSSRLDEEDFSRRQGFFKALTTRMSRSSRKCVSNRRR